MSDTATRSTCSPFRIESASDDPVRRSLVRVAGPTVERVLRIPAINDIYDQIQRRQDDRHFVDKALEVLKLEVRVEEDELARVPKSGPLAVVANHPFGGIEGLILLSLLLRARPDVKLMVNYLLSAMPDVHDFFLFVDPFGGPEAARNNRASMRSAIQWVKQGHVLGVFPAGEVSHLQLSRRAVADPSWSATIAKIVRRTGAAVLPVFFDGRNSNLFQLMGMIHPRLRTLMLPRELLRMRRGLVDVRIGSPITPQRLTRFSGADDITSYLRLRTYLLKPERGTHAPCRSDRVCGTPVVGPPPPEQVVDEIMSLPEDHRLLTQRDCEVVYARAEQIPTVLREIGRLREIAFRKVGEGTGQAIDLDRFDRDYLHLFVWDRSRACIVGAYRLGQTDALLDKHGKNGLYTSTLFRFQRRLLEQITPALELGRSFVHPDHQKSFAPLMLLWKGIGRYVVRHPRYRYLIGPVSISAAYSSMSKLLLMRFLMLHRYLPDMGKMLRPRNPARLSGPRDWDSTEFSTVVRDLDEVNDLVADLEADGKPMPVLLRHYLKLNAVLLGFNVDPEFGDVLDGLMLCDLTKVDRPILTRYMGRDGAAGFMKHHGVNDSSPQ